MYAAANNQTIMETASAKVLASLKTWLPRFKAAFRDTAIKIMESSSETDVKRFEGYL